MTEQKTTKVEEEGSDEVYAMWYHCLHCFEHRILRGFVYCPKCGREINWGLLK